MCAHSSEPDLLAAGAVDPVDVADHRVPAEPWRTQQAGREENLKPPRWRPGTSREPVLAVYYLLILVLHWAAILSCHWTNLPLQFPLEHCRSLQYRPTVLSNIKLVLVPEYE